MAENTEPGPGPAQQRKKTIAMLVVLAFLLTVPALLTWRVANRRRTDADMTQGHPSAPLPSNVDQPVRGEQRASIDEGDAKLKQLGAGWSKDPGYARLLQQLSLRHLVAAAQLVASGESPRSALPFLSISGAFAVREEGRANQERRFMSDASFARYDVLGKMIGSIDAAAAGDAYAQLRPYCDAAFSEIGRPGKNFEDELTAAVRRIVNVRFPQGDLELVPKGAVYAYADPALESLSGAEKQVLRMGPTNGRVLQRQLSDFARAAKLNLSPDVR